MRGLCATETSVCESTRRLFRRATGRSRSLPAPAIERDYPENDAASTFSEKTLVGTESSEKQPLVTESSVAVENETPTVASSLPPGWERRLTATSTVYYVDHNARRSSWYCPAVEAVEGLPAGWERAWDEKGRLYYKNHNKKTTSWYCPGVKLEEDLPAGWERAWDEKGRLYFKDHLNEKTTWVKPREKGKGMFSWLL